MNRPFVDDEATDDEAEAAAVEDELLLSCI